MVTLSGATAEPSPELESAWASLIVAEDAALSLGDGSSQWDEWFSSLETPTKRQWEDHCLPAAASCSVSIVREAMNDEGSNEGHADRSKDDHEASKDDYHEDSSPSLVWDDNVHGHPIADSSENGSGPFLATSALPIPAPAVTANASTVKKPPSAPKIKLTPLTLNKQHRLDLRTLSGGSEAPQQPPSAPKITLAPLTLNRQHRLDLRTLSGGSEAPQQPPSAPKRRVPPMSNTPPLPLPSQALPSQALPSQALPSQALPSQALPSPALPSPALPSQALPSQALPSQALPSQALPGFKGSLKQPSAPERLAPPKLKKLLPARPSQAVRWGTAPIAVALDSAGQNENARGELDLPAGVIFNEGARRGDSEQLALVARGSAGKQAAIGHKDTSVCHTGQQQCWGEFELSAGIVLNESARRGDLEQLALAARGSDGHCWLKYGQKRLVRDRHVIRCYYRCASSKTSGCRMRKRIDVDFDTQPVSFDSVTFAYSGACHNHPPPLLQLQNLYSDGVAATATAVAPALGGAAVVVAPALGAAAAVVAPALGAAAAVVAPAPAAANEATLQGISVLGPAKASGSPCYELIFEAPQKPTQAAANEATLQCISLSGPAKASTSPVAEIQSAEPTESVKNGQHTTSLRRLKEGMGSAASRLQQQQQQSQQQQWRGQQQQQQQKPVGVLLSTVPPAPDPPFRSTRPGEPLLASLFSGSFPASPVLHDTYSLLSTRLASTEAPRRPDPGASCRSGGSSLAPDDFVTFSASQKPAPLRTDHGASCRSRGSPLGPKGFVTFSASLRCSAPEDYVTFSAAQKPQAAVNPSLWLQRHSLGTSPLLQQGSAPAALTPMNPRGSSFASEDDPAQPDFPLEPAAVLSSCLQRHSPGTSPLLQQGSVPATSPLSQQNSARATSPLLQQGPVPATVTPLDPLGSSGSKYSSHSQDSQPLSTALSTSKYGHGSQLLSQQRAALQLPPDQLQQLLLFLQDVAACDAHSSQQTEAQRLTPDELQQLLTLVKDVATCDAHSPQQSPAQPSPRLMPDQLQQLISLVNNVATCDAHFPKPACTVEAATRQLMLAEQAEPAESAEPSLLEQVISLLNGSPDSPGTTKQPYQSARTSQAPTAPPKPAKPTESAEPTKPAKPTESNRLQQPTSLLDEFSDSPGSGNHFFDFAYITHATVSYAARTATACHPAKARDGELEWVVPRFNLLPLSRPDAASLAQEKLVFFTR